MLRTTFAPAARGGAALTQTVSLTSLTLAASLVLTTASSAPAGSSAACADRTLAASYVGDEDLGGTALIGPGVYVVRLQSRDGIRGQRVVALER